MWSFFSRDILKDFGYDIGTQVDCDASCTFWILHAGKKKATGEEVSVFIFDATSSDGQMMLDVAKATVKRLKMLRHPSILIYIDSLETEKLVYFVTEKVVPLQNHLSSCTYTEKQKKLAISWGLYQITLGIKFLNLDCNLSHNNVCMSSIFVNKAGQWCLFGVEYMSTCKDRVLTKALPTLQKYDPPELGKSVPKTVTEWVYDSWGLGCLIFEVFNGPLQSASALKSPGKVIPHNLSKPYMELINTNPLQRQSPVKFLETASKQNGFFKNKFVDMMLFLSEIHVRSSDETNRFFTNLTSSLDLFPQDICLYKLLPELINAFEYGNAGSSVLSPMFKLGNLLSEEEYQQKIVPCIVKMFSSKERTTRAQLLQRMEEFIHHMNPNIVNSQIFPNVAQGFLDTSPAIREYTIKCMLCMAPKLNYMNLNEEMLKHFARLQTKDDQGGIRTNTTVCLGKIASYLHPQTRKKILISAFLRALRDPFPPARSASILALSATEHYYSVNDIATKLLPSLCHFTVDPDKNVRDQAFKAIGGFIKKLQKVSEDPSLQEEMEKELQSMTPSEVAASWTSWAVTSLVDKLHMSRSAATSPSSNPVSPTKSQPKETEIVDEDSTSKKSEDRQMSNIPIQEGNDWDDEWKDFEDNDSPKHNIQSDMTTQKEEPSACEWEAEGWESFDTTSEEQQADNRLKSYFPNVDSDDPFSFITETQKGSPPPKSKNNSDDWNTENNEWDSWTNGSTAATVSTKAAERQRINEERQVAREEKRKQRLQASKQTRPMKLGAQKLS